MTPIRPVKEFKTILAKVMAENEVALRKMALGDHPIGSLWNYIYDLEAQIQFLKVEKNLAEADRQAYLDGLREAERAIKLIISQTGNPDSGEACRLVIKTGAHALATIQELIKKGEQ